jgi:hypothetical protein
MALKRLGIGVALLALASVMLIAAACGGDEPDPLPTPVPTATQVPPTPTPVPTATPEPTPVPEAVPQGPDDPDDPVPAIDPTVLVGQWDGTILAMGLQINFTVEFVLDGDDLTGSVSVPGQGIEEASIGKVSLGQTSINFTDPSSGVTFDGEYDGIQIKGTFENQGLTFGFTMTRVQ